MFASAQYTSQRQPASRSDHIPAWSPTKYERIPDALLDFCDLEKASKVEFRDRQNFPPLDRQKLGYHLRIPSRIITPSLSNLHSLVTKILKPLDAAGRNQLFDNDGYYICFGHAMSDALEALHSQKLLMEIKSTSDCFAMFNAEQRQDPSKMLCVEPKKKLPESNASDGSNKFHHSMTAAHVPNAPVTAAQVRNAQESTVPTSSLDFSRHKEDILQDQHHDDAILAIQRPAATSTGQSSRASSIGARTAARSSDDNVSVLSAALTSERSSVASGRRKKACCGICKKHSPLDAFMLGHCAICRRYFHRGCDGSTTFSLAGTWRCKACETKHQKPSPRLSEIVSSPSSGRPNQLEPVLTRAIRSSPGPSQSTTESREAESSSTTGTIPVKTGSQTRTLPQLASELSSTGQKISSTEMDDSSQKDSAIPHHDPVPCLIVKFRFQQQVPRDVLHTLDPPDSAHVPDVVKTQEPPRLAGRDDTSAAQHDEQPAPSPHPATSTSHTMTRDRVDSASSLTKPRAGSSRAETSHISGTTLVNEVQQSMDKVPPKSTTGARVRPPYTYVKLVEMALQQAPGYRLQSRGIIEWVCDNVPGYDKTQSDLRSGISNALSIRLHHPNSNLKSVERKEGDAGSGQWYEVIAGLESSLPVWDPMRKCMMGFDPQANAAVMKRRTNTPTRKRKGDSSAGSEISSKRRKVAVPTHALADGRGVLAGDMGSWSSRFMTALDNNGQRHSSKDASLGLRPEAVAPSQTADNSHARPMSASVGELRILPDLAAASLNRSPQPVQLVVKRHANHAYRAQSQQSLRLSLIRTVAAFRPQPSGASQAHHVCDSIEDALAERNGEQLQKLSASMQKHGGHNELEETNRHLKPDHSIAPDKSMINTSQGKTKFAPQDTLAKRQQRGPQEEPYGNAQTPTRSISNAVERRGFQQSTQTASQTTPKELAKTNVMAKRQCIQEQHQRLPTAPKGLMPREIQETQLEPEIDSRLDELLTNERSGPVTSFQDKLAQMLKDCSSSVCTTPIEAPSVTKGVSLVEIKRRPNRKEMIRRGRNWSRLGHNIALQRMISLREGLVRASTSTSDVDSGNGEGEEMETDNDYGVADIDFDNSQPEQFKCLEDLVEMPRAVVPILYEGQLVFTDKTKNARGRSGRAKHIYRVGGAAKAK